MVRMKDGKASSCLFVCFIVVIIVVFNTLPAIFYCLPSNENESKSIHLASQDNSSLICDVQRVKSDSRFKTAKLDFLLSSACRNYLPWLSDFQHIKHQKDSNLSGIIAIDDGCGLHRTETDLKRLFGLASLMTKDCLFHGLPFMCSYFYRPFVNGSLCNEHWPTRDECTTVKTVHCQSEWKIIESLQRSSDYCIRLPDCTQLPAQQRNKTKKKLLPKSQVAISKILSENLTAGVYQRKEDYQCSPPCPAVEWLLREESLFGGTFIIHICLVAVCIASFIVFYTWARVKELRAFPHTITLLSVVFYLGAGLTYSMSFIVGRREAYCSHNDVISTWEDPTRFCIAQGAIFQFFFIASLVLFSTSVLNVLVAIYDLKKPGQSGILKRHSRLVFSVEVFVSLGVAGAIVSAVLNTSSYHNDSLQVICVPRNSKARFFSYTLPSQVTGIFGLIMAILFIKRMKQSAQFQAKNGAINKNVTAAGYV
ncbi:uncharacterized protein LOC134183712 isoform X2 [Corticium candelabrum]|uniref:uncharacterized protein LOC134183712 isoform X2 n=1 Tax=Corticium candelabrum TaxID=121492 RepID=UPI002E262477|nr:uncharacterized protein LOC134183712 isoform X2 [Corticium candelabrum]